MPDLITHMSVNYIIYQFLKKYWILPLFILGAVLPESFYCNKNSFLRLYKTNTI